ncbi:MAG TPA: zf-HC2 domain-containing protein [Candidatus Solibacter sp.]|jgi:anti-sigma factor RsiW|nr:zf-HC2 domain-containing protein [Candidatus Solibacter sp.]
MSIAHLSDEQLSAYLDGDADGTADAEAHLHLEECQACAQRLQLLRATSQAVASLPDTEPPRPLDLAFLHQGPAPAVPLGEARRRFVARVIHGRVSTWAPTAVAAAAVLALAITWAPRLVPSAPASTAGSSSRQALRTTATGKVSPSAGDSSLNDLVAPAAGSAVAPVSGSSVQRTAVASDGTIVTMLATPPRGTTGHAVQLLLRVVGGPKGTNLAPPGMEIFAAQGQNQLRLAGSEGTSRTLKPGEELDLTVEWTAGAMTGPPVAGSYSVIGRVFLAGGKLVEITLLYPVS